MPDQFERTRMLLGQDAMERFFSAKVAVFGVGGVGGQCVEALARMGIGRIDLFDNDRVCLSNINRQIIATHQTIGQHKVDAMKSRILDINPAAEVGAYKVFYSPDTAEAIDLSGYDYIVDAVDTVAAKLELVCRATALGVPIISAMGAANKLDPTAFEVADIYQTSVCPLARVMRTELRKRKIEKLKVVYSKELAMKPLQGMAADEENEGADSIFDPAEKPTRRRQIPASNSFVPPVAGLILAGEVVKDIMQGL